MKKILVLPFLALLILQIAGYYFVAKKTLVSKLLAERRPIAEIAEISLINVHSNVAFTPNQQLQLNQLFKGKPLVHHLFQDDEDPSEGSNFSEGTLNYTFEVTDYYFPIAVITQSETARGFVAYDATMYAWILCTWVEVKYLGGGIS